MANNEQKIIDVGNVVRTLWAHRRTFYKVWACTFVLACVWILPQPRYYISEVKLAPEVSGEDVGGGLSSIASSFGFNLGGMGGQDAIYPELYPELFENPSFVVGLYDIQVTNKAGSLTTTYFDYMKKHQKQNVLTKPFLELRKKVKSVFEKEDDVPSGSGPGVANPFMMSRKDYMLMKKIMQNIGCAVDKKTSVITISVQDQDPFICATMADSVRMHLQDFIIRYRTSKVAEDVLHYQQMRDSAEYEYDLAMRAYSRFCDAHQNAILQSFQSERDKLENDLLLKQNALTAMETQLQSTKVKLQQKTPAFTTLKTAFVPVKPDGPKRMLFVLGMLVLASMVTAGLILRKNTHNVTA